MAGQGLNKYFLELVNGLWVHIKNIFKHFRLLSKSHPIILVVGMLLAAPVAAIILIGVLLIYQYVGIVINSVMWLAIYLVISNAFVEKISKHFLKDNIIVEV